MALVAFRNEVDYLPGLLANIAPHVDGVIALDDGSTDRSRQFVDSNPLTINVIDLHRGEAATHDDYLLHSTLIRSAWDHDCDWLMGLDADERLSHDFRGRFDRLVSTPQAQEVGALWTPLRELWTPSTVRVDGIWGAKRVARVFRSRRDHVFDRRPLHGFWPSLDGRQAEWPMLDSPIYHLRMMTPQGRERRSQKYRRLDPDRAYQAIGYDYMVDEKGLETEVIPPDDLRVLHHGFHRV